MTSMPAVGVADDSFANAPGLNRQVDYVMLMADEEHRANVVQYGSSRGHCVIISIKAAEIYALIHAVNIDMIIRDALNERLRRSVGIQAFVDSWTLFNVVSKNRNTVERRLQIDIFALKENYQRGE